MKNKLTPVVAAAIIGSAGLSLIQASEGLRLNSYIDAAGIPTVCYGHTGPEVRLGQRYTPEDCDRLLLDDIRKHQVVLTGPKNCIAGAPLTANQKDGLTSLVFNIGTTKFCKSTMAKRLSARDYIGAADEFPKWDKATVNGQLVALRGLTTRRQKERALFLTPAPIPSTRGVSARFMAILK